MNIIEQLEVITIFSLIVITKPKQDNVVFVHAINISQNSNSSSLDNRYRQELLNLNFDSCDRCRISMYFMEKQMMRPGFMNKFRPQLKHLFANMSRLTEDEQMYCEFSIDYILTIEQIRTFASYLTHFMCVKYCPRLAMINRYRYNTPITPIVARFQDHNFREIRHTKRVRRDAVGCQVCSDTLSAFLWADTGGTEADQETAHELLRRFVIDHICPTVGQSWMNWYCGSMWYSVCGGEDYVKSIKSALYIEHKSVEETCLYDIYCFMDKNKEVIFPKNTEFPTFPPRGKFNPNNVATRNIVNNLQIIFIIFAVYYYFNIYEYDLR